MYTRILSFALLVLTLCPCAFANGVLSHRGSDKLLRFDSQPRRTHTLGLPRPSGFDPVSSIPDAYDFGTLQAEDGSSWFYTVSFGESAEFPYCYGSADIDLYDSSNQQVVSLHYEVPAGMKVNAIEPFGAVSRKFYDTNSNTREFTVYVHEIGAGYTSVGHILVYNTKGELVQQYDADNLVWVDASEKWNVYQRAILSTTGVDAEGNKTTTLSVLKPASWNSSQPEVEHVFELRNDLTEYSNGPSLNTYVIDGSVYYVLSYYQKPYVTGYDENYDMILAADNNYLVEVYDNGFQQVADLCLPVTHPDDVYCSLYSVGLYSAQDLTRGYFSADDQLNLVVTRTDVRLDTDDDTYPNTFLVYDMQGNQLKTIASNVTSWKQLQTIPSAPDQVGCICLNEGVQTLQMINLPSCELQVEFDALLPDGRRVSSSFDRYTAADGYQYAIGMGNATTNRQNDVIASIGWFTSDGQFAHYTDFNLGQNGEYFTPLIEGYTLNPALFDTDDAREYIYIAKIRRSDGSEVIDNVLVIADEQGNELQRFVGDDDRVMRVAAVIDTEIRKPRLVVGYSSNESGLYNLDFYDLPFAKFAQGGDGSEQDPYIISSAGDMFQIPSDPNACYLLGQDIDMSLIAEPWAPVASFGGKLDGAGYEVSNLYIKADDSYCGLFGYMNDGATLGNVTFSDARMQLTRGNSYAGLVAGMTIKSAITDVMVRGFKVTADAAANAEFGGLVGQATYFTQLAANGIVDADYALGGCNSVGGLVGSTRTGTTIDACLFAGAATAGNRLGGLVGTSGTDCTIRNCHVNASLQAQTTVGGIVADAARAQVCNNLVEGSLEATEVDMYGNAAVGGIAGQLESDWSSSATKHIVANVVSLSSITAPANAKAVHRIVGFTIADEQYEEDETHKVENGLDQNYAAQDLDIQPAVADETKAADRPDGADYSVLTRSFLEGLGFAYGTDTQAPWMGDGTPYLYFEEASATAIQTPTGDTSAAASQAVFNLHGQRVTQPQRGFYIHNRHKVLLR